MVRPSRAGWRAESLRLSHPAPSLVLGPIWSPRHRFLTDTWLVFIGPLLEPVASAPGFPPGDAWQVFVPGLLVQLAVFGAALAGFGLIAEWRAGVVERMRVTPASRRALLLGRALRDVVVIVVQGALLSVVAVVFFGLDAPIESLVTGVVIVGLLGGAFSALSYGAALKLKSEDSFAPVINGLLLPVLLLSGILLPMTLAPGWLQTVADVNPLTHVVDGVRAVYRGRDGLERGHARNCIDARAAGNRRVLRHPHLSQRVGLTDGSAAADTITTWREASASSLLGATAPV